MRKPVTSNLSKFQVNLEILLLIGVMEVAPRQTDKYGIVSGNFLPENKRALLMDSMIEKPAPSESPSNLATPGRYILDSKIFNYLRLPKGTGGEYKLTDAIKLMMAQEEVYAHKFEGKDMIPDLSLAIWRLR